MKNKEYVMLTVKANLKTEFLLREEESYRIKIDGIEYYPSVVQK